MKILILKKRNKTENIGGPTGYLYNISEYLKQNPCEEIEFLREEGLQETLLSRCISYFIAVLISITKKWPIQHAPLIVRNFLYGCKLTKSSIDYLNKFDAIHVHSAPMMIQYFKKNKVTAKLILTSHCPSPVIDEMSDTQVTKDFYTRHKSLRNWILNQEVKAYDICDYIMFPVPQAREPYENATPIYKKKFSLMNDKFFYVPTALNSVEMIADNNHVLDQFSLDDKALRVCYIGRHNETKGYFFLKQAAKKCLQEIPDTHFFIGGMIDCTIGLDDSRWHELGWVNTPSLVNEMDVFILPNKDTYFDLVLLEVLRQGTPVLLSKTGGNKWFEDKNIEGIKLFEYDNVNELASKVVEIKKIKAEGNLEKIKADNRKFFKETFDMKLYIKEYLKEVRKRI